MSMMDHYPSKKRRLSLNTKTPTRVSSIAANIPSTQQIVSPTISEITLPKKKHKASPAGNSADDSAVEIHWDNNSPTSQALRPKRGRPKRGSKNNKSLSSLIKQIPKTRKSIESNLTENQDFSTWMQQNLAPVCTRRTTSILRQNSSRASMSRGSKIEALDFNEKIKKFLNDVQATSQKNSQRSSGSTVDIRVSPCMLTAAARQHAQSPSYFSNSSADSLLNMDDFNLEDSLLVTSLNTSPPAQQVTTTSSVSKRGTPLRSCRARNNATPPTLTTSTDQSTRALKTPVRPPNSSTSTPLLTRSGRKRPTSRPVPKLETVNEVPGKSRTNQSDPKLPSKNRPLTAPSPLIDNFDEHDDLDHLIATQPEILLNNNKQKGANGQCTKTNNEPAFTKLKDEASNNKKNQQKMKSVGTPPAASLRKQSAAAISTTPDLLDQNNGDNDFDDLLASFDMDDMKCLSQDSASHPPSTRLTESQRKMKTKCHTSPLPLNYNQKKLLDRINTTSFVPITKPVANSSKKLDHDMQTLSIHSPSALSRKTNFQSTSTRTSTKTPITININKQADNANNVNLINCNNNRTMISNTNKSGDKFNAPKSNFNSKKNPINTNTRSNNHGTAPGNCSFVRTSMVTSACRKPFQPPKQSQVGLDMSAVASMTLDLSVIEGSSININATQSSPRGQLTRSFFASTQKCSMAEIEEKRKFAQTKLRERLRKKQK